MIQALEEPSLKPNCGCKHFQPHTRISYFQCKTCISYLEIGS